MSSLCKAIGTLPAPRPSPLHRRGGLREGVSWDVYVKDFCEGLDEGIFDLWEGKGRAQFGGHGREPLSRMPQGTIKLNPLRSVLTLRAKPCMETQRESLTPMAAILRGGFRSQTPAWPGMRSPQRPYHPIARIIISYRLHRVFQGEDSGETTFMNFLIRF